MSKTLRTTLAIIGAALVIAGLIIGLTPVYAGTVNCGSAFHADTLDAIAQAMRGNTAGLGCQAARSTRLTITWVLIAPGLMLGIAALFAWAADNKPREVASWSTQEAPNVTPSTPSD